MSERLAILQTEESIKEIRKLKAEIPELIRLAKDLRIQTDALNKSFSSSKPKDYMNALKDLTAVSRQYQQVQQQLSAQMERLSRVERNNAQAAESNARARYESARALTEESRARQQATREATNEARRNAESSSAYKKLKKDVQEATLKARDYGAEMVALNRKRRDGTITTEEYRRKMALLSKDFKNSTKEALALQKELDKLNRATSAHAQKKGALDGRVTDILKAFGITSIVDNIASSFYRLGEKAFETSKKLDTLRLAQRSVFKTDEEIGKQNEFLSTIANRYGIEILGLSDAYTKFAASAQGTYLEGNRTQNIFDAVTKSSAMLGVTTDDTTGILRALGQMMSKGKVQAEELRGQLGDRMAGAFKLFADGMGVSTAELDAMLKKGEVLADDVLPKFAAQLNKKYKLGIGQEIDTQAAATNRAANAWVAFVDGVENSSGVFSKTVIGYSNALSNLLKALTPSKEVSFIEKEQANLNMLGIELRQNWKDEKKRKEIIDEILKLNPFFLEGLDKEHLTLEAIGKQLQNVNEQYIQKIALEKQAEKIKELVEDQAQAYIYLNRIFVENAAEYNNLNEATKKTLDNFKNGTLGYFDALGKINKSTKSFTKENDVAVDMLNQMNAVIAQSTLNFDGFNRGIDGNKIALKGAIGEYESLKNIFGNIVSQQQQLVYMNGLTAKSYNALGKEQKDKWVEFAELAKKATLEGNNFFLLNNQWRAKNAKGGWFSTGKKADDWYLENNKLLKRQKAVLPPKDEKPKAASLTSAQKDQMNIYQAEKDTALAYLTQRQNEGLINEQQFQEKRIAIIKSYAGKVSSYLLGNNAKEKQVEGRVILRASTEIKGALKEQFDYFAKQSDENYKKTQNTLERQSKELEKNDFLTDTERLEKQIKLDSESLEKAVKFYDDQISIANSFHQDTLELERKRDEEIGKIQDARTDKMRSRLTILQQDLERQATEATANSNLSFEEQKSLILSDKKLSNDEKAYRISLLEIDKQIEQNKLEIEKLKALKAQYDVKVAMASLSGNDNPEAKKTSAELGEQIKTLENTNTDLNNEAKNTISKQTEALRGAMAAGFKTLGFDQLADAYTKTMDRLKGETADWKDYANLAATAVLETLSKLTDAQKEKTIAALDEQLKSSQKVAEQEESFLQSRIDALNSLGDLTQEQIDARSQLEDEARAVREQQQQKEKMIETQKAKAEQRASSNQALINGALGATQSIASYGFTPAGAIAAALALTFGIAQSISIMSKDPTPKYWKGRMDGPSEWAITQDQGREIIADKNDNIISTGSDGGSKKTWLNKGDKVYTASQTKSILKNLGGGSKIGQNIFRKVALNSLKTPPINFSINNSNTVDYDRIINGFRQIVDNGFNRNSNPRTDRKGGFIIEYNGSKFPVILGEYDLKTFEETYYDSTN